MKTIKILCLLYCIFVLSSFAVSSREVIDINTGWHIFNPYRPWTERASHPGDEKAGKGKPVDLPHDFSIEGPFRKENPSGQAGGYLPGGKALYRKDDVFIKKEWKGQKIFIAFEGIYQNSTVYVNGIKAGFRPNGWVPITYEISKWLKFGENNMIAVLVDNTQIPNCRWYSGSGIYRPVRLIIKDNLNIDNDGIFVTTPVINEDFAIIRSKTAVKNEYDIPQRFDIIQEIIDSKGMTVAADTSDFYLPRNHSKEFEQNTVVWKPDIWDIDNPDLYTLKTSICQNGETIDETATVFGIRSIEFTADKGFYLNGKRLKLKGVCLHHDGGMTGAAVPPGIWERRLKILKDMGCNAVRTSHNPFDPAFYDICDKMGFLVMDEFFDEWTTCKLETVPYGSHMYWDEWHKKDLTDLVKRDRNHPSVILWSVGNEISEQAYPEGYKIARELVDLIYSLDNTRPVTCGNNKQIEANLTGFADEFDIAGYNYGPQFGNYERDRAKYPFRKFIGTESTRGKSNRGVYVFPVSENGKMAISEDNYYSSYDGKFRIYGQEKEWEITENYDYISGMFIWTGIDYIGETSFPFPTKYSDFGVLDVCGFPKDAYYFYRSVWNEKDITLHILPHWNWQDRKGEKTPVWCYTNCDEVELFLNGKSQGIRKSGDNGMLHLEWNDVLYEAGQLKAVGYVNGKKVKETTVATTGKATEIHLEADKPRLESDGADVVHITVSTLDSNGRFVPDAQNALDYHVEGGKLLGIDNGDPQYVGNYKHTEGRTLFNGLSLIIIQSDPDDPFIEVTVTGDNLKTGKIKIKIN